MKIALVNDEQEYLDEMAKLIHDLCTQNCCQIETIPFLNGEDFLAADIGSIQTHLAGYKARLAESTPVNYCANVALNALFGYYYEMAVSAGIDTDWHIELPKPLPATELDMVSLFGNLMENAIDGCRTVQSGRRYFCLTAQIRHGSRLYIVSTNNFDGKVRKGKHGYHSTKRKINTI